MGLSFFFTDLLHIASLYHILVWSPLHLSLRSGELPYTFSNNTKLRGKKYLIWKETKKNLISFYSRKKRDLGSEYACAFWCSLTEKIKEKVKNRKQNLTDHWDHVRQTLH